MKRDFLNKRYLLEIGCLDHKTYSDAGLRQGPYQVIGVKFLQHPIFPAYIKANILHPVNSGDYINAYNL